MAEGIVYFDAPAAGQWGAPCLVDDRYIVAWPTGGTNYSVLVHDTADDTNTTHAIGSNILFESAAVGGDGKVYASSSTASTDIHTFDVSTSSFSTISHGASSRRWTLFAADGDVFGYARNAGRLLHVDVSAQTASDTEFDNGNTTGVVSATVTTGNGDVYAVSNSQNQSPSRVLKLVPSTQTVTLITPTGGTSGRTWGTASLHSSGLIVAFPENATNNSANGYMVVDPATDTATIYSRTWGNYDFEASASSDLVYAISVSGGGGTDVLISVDPTGPTATDLGNTDNTEAMIVATTGVVYAMPRDSDDVLRVENSVLTTITGTVSVAGTSRPAVQVGVNAYAVTLKTDGIAVILKVTDIAALRRGIYLDGAIHLS